MERGLIKSGQNSVPGPKKIITYYRITRLSRVNAMRIPPKICLFVLCMFSWALLLRKFDIRLIEKWSELDYRLNMRIIHYSCPEPTGATTVKIVDSCEVTKKIWSRFYENLHLNLSLIFPKESFLLLRISVSEFWEDCGLSLEIVCHYKKTWAFLVFMCWSFWD